MPISLLNEPIISVRHQEHAVEAATLPEVLAHLIRNGVIAFESLQPHQVQAWHSFLVQIAAMAVARSNASQIPEDADTWRRRLLELSRGSEEAWCLVVEDLAKPAFMQPPVPEGSLEKARFKADILTPDQLDILVTAKNHDLKGRRIVRPRPEHWLYALCSLQTMEGFLGRGNYGIVRMNGGFGNRPMVGLTKELSWGERFMRDLNMLLAVRNELMDRYDSNGHALLWLQPWDGGKRSGITLQECDPYFVEICRRVRLKDNDGRIECWRTNSKAQRVQAPKELKGITGDPWTPVEKKGMKALTVGESGFTYELLSDIFLSGEYDRPPALEFRPDEREGAYLIARTLVRGQGKTDGLQYRIIPVSKRASLFLSGGEENRQRLGKRAEFRIQKADEVRRRVLYPAVAALLSSGRDQRVEWDRAAPWMEGFGRAIDEQFFESLWKSVEMGEDEAQIAWEDILWDEAQGQFAEAERSAPVADIRRWRARSRARSVFHGSARRILIKLFSDRQESKHKEVHT